MHLCHHLGDFVSRLDVVCSLYGTELLCVFVRILIPILSLLCVSRSSLGDSCYLYDREFICEDIYCTCLCRLCYKAPNEVLGSIL